MTTAEHTFEDDAGTAPAPSTDLAITDLLHAWERGHPQAGNRVFSAVLPQLRRLARRKLAQELSSISLQATDLINEAYIRLAAHRISWQCRAQFFAMAATIFRRVLLDHAKRRLRAKRGGGATAVVLDEGMITSPAEQPELLDLNRALNELATIRVTAARVVELKVFGGLSLDEIAAALGLSRNTVQRRWRFAKAWLATRLTVSP